MPLTKRDLVYESQITFFNFLMLSMVMRILRTCEMGTRKLRTEFWEQEEWEQGKLRTRKIGNKKNGNKENWKQEEWEQEKIGNMRKLGT